MGRSAKVHKRAQTKKSTSSTSVAASTSKPTISAATERTQAVAQSKKKSGLKDKAKVKATTAPGIAKGTGYVLGGADYVDLMLGTRKKARQEAAKLPKDES